jgi:GTPase SAR1 family protein
VLHGCCVQVEVASTEVMVCPCVRACVRVCACTPQVTYKNLEQWYEELQEHCKGIPTIVIANKIDVDYKVTSKSFNFAAKVGGQ